MLGKVSDDSLHSFLSYFKILNNSVDFVAHNSMITLAWKPSISESLLCGGGLRVKGYLRFE